MRLLIHRLYHSLGHTTLKFLWKEYLCSNIETVQQDTFQALGGSEIFIDKIIDRHGIVLHHFGIARVAQHKIHWYPMKSKAYMPAKTIKKICHPWRLAMMKNNEWHKESRGFQSVSHINETAARQARSAVAMSHTMHAERSCTIMAATKWCSMWHFKLASACLPVSILESSQELAAKRQRSSYCSLERFWTTDVADGFPLFMVGWCLW